MRVAYATGSRADYGIVRNYLKLLDLDPSIDLSILVTGSHLEDKYGKSVDIIVSDGFSIDFKAPLGINNSTNANVIHSMSTALDLFGRYFEDNKYDLLIILGDRYEMMAVAIAAAMQRVPILHLHGGEATYGNYDEFIRHSITKMSTFHFASTEIYRNRIIQMGEDPNRVYYLGALGAENCQNIDECKVVDAVKKLTPKEYYVVAFHPETLTDITLDDQVNVILRSVNSFPEKEFVFMGTNADTGSDTIRNSWTDYANNHDNIHYFENLNTDSYLFLVRNAIALVGNSSSGIIEAPSLGVCTVNIGHRQDGRVSGNSVFNVECCESAIVEAMKKVLEFDPKTIQNPYYLPDTAERYYIKTKEILSQLNYIIKSFYDIKI